jgi:penicillin-binding protein-related factor A (putative recombinase)
MGKEVMAKSNLGKKFEDVIKESFLKCPDVSIDRLRDAPKKMKNVDNPSDFIVYKYPHEIYVECKSHKGNTLPFSCIREEQITGMLEKSKIKGVLAGVIVWFIDHDLTVWIPINEVVFWRDIGNKSINIKNIQDKNTERIRHIVIQGKKKRIYFDYDMEDFLRRLYGC